MGVSLLVLIRWSWPPLPFVLLSRQSRPNRLTLSFWSSTVVSQSVRSFGRVFGPLYWPTTWSQLFWFSLERPVIDILCSWQIAHGVPRTGQRLVSTFGMFHIPIACFCNPWSVETLDHLFFSSRLAQAVLSWLQSLMSRCSALIPPSVLTVTKWMLPLVALCTC